MSYFGQTPYMRQNYYPPQYYQSIQQPFHPSESMQYYPNMYQQPQTPFEQFAKPTQPQDWYASNQQSQGNNQQSQANNQQAQVQNGAMPPFPGQGGQLNLDKVLSTVSQMANTYHQVSPIIKQFGDFMKAFRS